MSSMNDDQLVKAYAQGNNEAFDTLLSRHQERVYNYIVRIVRNEDVANDIFQDTFVKAITNIRRGRYTDSGKFPAWISRIAHNLIIDYFRQEKSENLQSCDIDEVDLLNRKDLSEATVEDLLITEQIHDDVRMLIDALLEATEKEIVLNL